MLKTTPTGGRNMFFRGGPLTFTSRTHAVWQTPMAGGKRGPGSVVIYFDPECHTSRNALAFLTKADYKPTIIEYGKVGWTKSQLLGLFAAADLSPRDALRQDDDNVKQLGLLNAGVSDEEILAQMVAHPHLVQSPIVCTRMGTRLTKPSEKVLDLMERLPPGPVYKEDGEMIIDFNGDRVIDDSSPAFHQ